MPQLLSASSTTAGSFNASEYKTDTAMYPSDLMDAKYGGNYLVIYINVNDGTRAEKDASAAGAIAPNSSYTRVNSLIARQNMSNTDVVAAASAAPILAGATGGNLLSRFLGNKAGSGHTLDTLLGAAGGAAFTGLVVTPVLSLAASTNRQQKRLRTVITMHLPNSIATNYAVDWSATDTTFPMISVNAIGALKDAFTSGKQTIDGLKHSAGVGSQVAASVAAFGLQRGPQSEFISGATGLAYNPRMEQIFKGVQIRTFQMDYSFFARSEQEANAIQNIIYLLKYHMHPEYLDANKFIYIYPSEFDIAYYSNGKENLSLARHPSCVLTSLTVNYTPNGQVNMAADGVPPQIDISMTFRELVEMNTEMIREGM